MSLPTYLRSGSDGLLVQAIEDLDARIKELAADSGVLLLGPTDAVPIGTKAGTVIVRIGTNVPIPPAEIDVLLGPGNVTELDINAANSTPELGLTDLPVPTNRQVGDLLVAVLGCQTTTSGSGAVTAPAGWISRFIASSVRRSEILTYAIPDNTALNALGSTVRFTPHADWASGRANFVMFRVVGADLANPWLGVTAQAQGDTDSAISPALTATGTTDLAINFAMANYSAGATPRSGTVAGRTLISQNHATHTTLNATTSVYLHKLKGIGSVNVPAAEIILDGVSSANLVSYQFALKKTP